KGPVTLSVVDDVADNGSGQHGAAAQIRRDRAGDGTWSIALREVLWPEGGGEVQCGRDEDAGATVPKCQVGNVPRSGGWRRLATVHNEGAGVAVRAAKEASRQGGGRLRRRGRGSGHTGGAHSDDVARRGQRTPKYRT